MHPWPLDRPPQSLGPESLAQPFWTAPKSLWEGLQARGFGQIAALERKASGLKPLQRLQACAGTSHSRHTPFAQRADTVPNPNAQVRP
ncbi:hypothetical protein [Lysobacter gummosus]|uniref:hypothetical protein n=1 Tax=Lysobacter gummosus TaxID=262324 RepID=UPI0036272B36